MLAYSMNGAHKRAVENAYSRGYFSESMFVRMRVLHSRGQWPSPAEGQLEPAHA
jgi:hypothetical protein